MRSPELRPPNPDAVDGNPGLFNAPEHIRHVVTTRSHMITSVELTRELVGRLLLVDYNITNHNEATEIESNGFFDWADNPPWDLWVGELGDLLVAWIPSPFVDTATHSMAYECMDMLHWADTNEKYDVPSWFPPATDDGG